MQFLKGVMSFFKICYNTNNISVALSLSATGKQYRIIMNHRHPDGNTFHLRHDGVISSLACPPLHNISPAFSKTTVEANLFPDIESVPVY